jgi:asparagine synthase (glutamine-hydrolysing)
MCGLVGFLGGNASPCGEGNGALIKRMTDAIKYRGPDDEGYWSDENQRIFLGHRRLAIVDLSAAGHQPMISRSGRYILVFNGEIYNHIDLRRELEKGGSVSWCGHSDTETLLSAFEVWGIKDTILRTIGMFAIAVWDKQTNILTLARDRIGEKPLYYGWQGDTFLFGSELKALRAHPAFKAEIDRRALCLLLRHNCIPAPYSVYKGILKLRPGCLLTVSMRQPEPAVETYWSGALATGMGITNVFKGNPIQAVDALEKLLKDAVLRQMVADVPLGAFLSGGVDSATVVALMQAQSARPVKTFTIGFENEGYNEAVYAKIVAQFLRTDHTELYVTSKQAMEVIPLLPSIYDEPFSDSSQIPTFLVSQLAKQKVSVSLSGDAGDELFCGYNRYQMTARLWRKMSVLSVSTRKILAQVVTGVSPQAWNHLASIFPRSLRGASIGDKLHKGANVLASDSVNALYLGLVSHWNDPASVVIDGHEPMTLLTGDAPELSGLDQIQRMMALDMLTYLPDDILVKLDRAAMCVSLESRVPFLDHRVVEFAWSLPQSMKLREGQSKWVLRQVLYRHVHKYLIERPKMGFGIPLHDWLRGPLRDWAETLLDEERLQREGYFHPAPIRKRWEEHLSGQRNWAYHLWDVLMFQSWLEANT